MKVVHLNTHSYGGAAVVARRLHRAALAGGVRSTLLTKYGLPDDATPEYRALRDGRVLYFLRAKSAQAGWYRAGKMVQRLMQDRHLAGRASGFDIFSPLNARPRFADCVALLEPDIIHLHWVNGFVDHADFFARNRERKFVWTLHDMNPFTGGCHHADGCGGFRDGCAQCPQLAGTMDAAYAATVLHAKQRALAELRDDQLTVVAPSQWLLELSRTSRVTGRFRHVLAENPATAPGAANTGERERLMLPRDRKVVAFAADNLRNARKGADLLFAALRAMPQKQQGELLCIGQQTDAPGDLAVTFTGRLDEAGVARYLAAADVLVCASVAENSPLSVIEALACGTPVVSMDVGGVKELLDTSSGVLVRERSAQALATALHEALFDRRFSRAAIRAQAARFAPAAVWRKYHQVYTELLAC